MKDVMKSCPYMKTVWEKCVFLCQEYIQKGSILKPKIKEMLLGMEISREEYAIQSRYMHRGFYCPSPVIEHHITNVRRGRIAKRLTSSAKPTNRYLFDAENKLRLAETFYPNGSVKSEYIFHENNVIYGIVYPSIGRSGEISIEQYEEGQIISYLWALWRESPNDGSLIVSRVTYETYCYDDDRYIVAEWYDIAGNLGVYHKYRLSLSEEGAIIPRSVEVLKTETGACG